MQDSPNNNMMDYVADAQLVLKKYPIELFLINKHHFKDRKAVWFIKTNKELLALKRYKLGEKQWRAMISAYDYLSKQGSNVSPLIYTWDNTPWVYYNNYYYILTHWVKGRPPDWLLQEDILALARAIGNLHRVSKDFQVPQDSFWRENLGTWPELARRRQGLLLEYRYEAESQFPESFSKIYLENFQTFFGLFEDVAEVLEGPLYKKWIKEVSEEPCLCINGFSSKDFSLGKDQNIWILHLDNICIDLPARDLRKFIYRIMYLKNTWCKEIFSSIMEEYLTLHPLSSDQLKILLVELKTPYYFFNVTSSYYCKSNPWSPKEATSNLTKILKLEQSKLNLLYRFWQLL